MTPDDLFRLLAYIGSLFMPIGLGMFLYGLRLRKERRQ